MEGIAGKAVTVILILLIMMCATSSVGMKLVNGMETTVKFLNVIAVLLYCGIRYAMSIATQKSVNSTMATVHTPAAVAKKD